MKKFISVFICLIMVLSMIPFTASAADAIDFKLRIKEETDSTVTLTIDYDGGTGFSALDFEVTYDRTKLQIDSFQEGEGYEAFSKKIKKSGQLSICELNSRVNPLKASIANTVGFAAADGKKSIIEMKFIKVQGTKFAKEDVSVEFTNCQTDAFTDIKVSFAYDLTAPSGNGTAIDSSVNSTDSAQQSSDIKADDGNDAGDKPNQNVSEDEENNAENNDGKGMPRTTVVIIIVVAVVCVAGAAAFVVLKKKKKD